MTKFGKRLLQSVAEAHAIAKGEIEPARAVTIDTPDVAAIRKGLGLSQDKFAKRFKLSAATVRDWEQGRRIPDAPARNLLKVIQYAPETVERALD
jgi:putative transcriptional regulator